MSMNHLLYHLVYSLNEAKAFLNSTIDNFHDGKSMKDLSKAVALMKESIENNKKVLIVGDYDVGARRS